VDGTVKPRGRKLKTEPYRAKTKDGPGGRFYLLEGLAKKEPAKMSNWNENWESRMYPKPDAKIYRMLLWHS
jgi:hypothetical protein